MKDMRSIYMRLFYALLVCIFTTSVALVAQESQDNQPHIQPRNNEASAPKTKPDPAQRQSLQKQSQPNQPQSPPQEQPQLQDASPKPAESSSQNSTTGDSSSRDSEIDLNAGSRNRLPVPADDSNDEEGFRPFDPHRAMKDQEVGNYYLKQKNYRAALERFNDALKYKPNDAEATYSLAFTQEKLELLEQSRKNYSKYLELLPDGPKAKDSEEGLKRVEARLDTVASRDGSDQEAAENVAVGEQFLARNDFYSARQRFEAAVRVAPENATANFRLAQSLRGMQLLEPARLYFKKYLELDPRGVFASDAKRAIGDITLIVGK